MVEHSILHKTLVLSPEKIRHCFVAQDLQGLLQAARAWKEVKGHKKQNVMQHTTVAKSRSSAWFDPRSITYYLHNCHQVTSLLSVFSSSKWGL